MNFTIIADSVDKSHRYKFNLKISRNLVLTFDRTRYMYVLAGIPHLTTLIAPPLSGVLMVIKIWLPFVIAAGALLVSLLIVAIMPESLNRHHSLHAKQGQSSPLLGAGDALTPNEVEEESPSSPEQLPCGVHDRLPAPDPETKEWWRDIIVLVQMPGLPFCYTLFFFKPLAMISKAFVYQYASYNFHWGLSQTTWLRFAQAGGSSLATVAILPLLSSVLVRRGLRAQLLDLNVIRVSLVVATAGFVLLQFSYHSWMLLLGRIFAKTIYWPTLTFLALFICGLSEGEEPALQGLATSLIDRAYHARLFTSVAVLEILAKLVGGPMMGKLFAIGKEGGQGSKGLCFSVSVVCC